MKSDTQRLLDARYSPSATTRIQLAYVDTKGVPHDPDYRDFPVISPSLYKLGTAAWRKRVSAPLIMRGDWSAEESEDDEDNEEEEEDTQEYGSPSASFLSSCVPDPVSSLPPHPFFEDRDSDDQFICAPDTDTVMDCGTPSLEQGSVAKSCPLLSTKQFVYTLDDDNNIESAIEAVRAEKNVLPAIKRSSSIRRATRARSHSAPATLSKTSGKALCTAVDAGTETSSDPFWFDPATGIADKKLYGEDSTWDEDDANSGYPTMSTSVAKTSPYLEDVLRWPIELSFKLQCRVWHARKRLSAALRK